MTWVQFNQAELKELLSHRPILALASAKTRRSIHDKLVEALEAQPVHKLLGSQFVDSRGRIADLITGPIDAVTLIHSLKGAIRGNHVHKQTTQWTYVLSGSLLMVNGSTEATVFAGQMAVEEPGVPHAWKALEDTDCLVFTQGPRSGDQYESDTFRLDVPLL